MKKDLWIGAMTAMIAHSGIVLFSLIQPLRTLQRPPTDQITAVVPFNALPELVDPPDDTPRDEPKPDVPAPPSLQDTLSARMDSPFVQPVQPTPPVVSGDPVRILPTSPAWNQQPGPKTFNLIDLSQAPVATSTPNPIYPFELRRSGVEGKAVVDFIVDEHGNVLRPYALEGTQAEFGRAAVEGLRRWHFRPGIKDGRAVRTHMQIPIEFSLQK